MNLLAVTHTLSRSGLSILQGHCDLWKPESLILLLTYAISLVVVYFVRKRRPAPLEAINHELEQEVAERRRIEEILRSQVEQDRLMSAITHQIRRSLQLDEILKTTVFEIRQLLQIDRVLIYRFAPDWSGSVTVEAVGLGCTPIAGKVLSDPCLADPARIQRYAKGHVQAIADIEVTDLSPCYRELLVDLEVRANLVVPILLHPDRVWGLLAAHHCSAPRSWLSHEVDLLQQLATQVGIAIQQAQLYHQVQQFNLELEAKVQQRTAQLQQSLDFESLLIRITDNVRDRLDEAQILQTAVQELANGLNTYSCTAGLYNLDQQASVIRYEYVSCKVPSVLGAVETFSENAEIYQRLLSGHNLQLSWLPYGRPLCPSAQPFTTLIYPLIDDQGVIGDLWLYRAGEAVFEEVEVRLVQQVANQCAIAIRQARLYQVAQCQVQELQRLNYLKDDFLSTVSHELRTPMSSIQMAAEMLHVLLEPTGLLSESGTVGRYFCILQSECQREIGLINDLLDLSRLDAEVEPLTLTTIDFAPWMCHLIEPFEERTRQQKQQLQIDLPPDLPALTVDLFFLERILTELLQNACKYTPANEVIRISTQTTPAALQLNISNSGTEIPADELVHVFDKFYRVPNQDPWKHGGTGLGLALVKKRVQQLQGAIAVSSQEGWTHFTLQLPWSTQSAPESFPQQDTKILHEEMLPF